MSLFDIFGKKSIQKQKEAYYQERKVLPDFGNSHVSPRTPGQIFAYLSQHPGWRQIPTDVLKELSLRVADRSRRWLVYDVDHALEILVLMTEKSNALEQNFIPICQENKPPMNTPEAKLYLFSMTFEQLASKFIREISEFGDSIPERRVANALEDAKAYAEASLICDRYFLASFMPAAWGWVMKNGDRERAVNILNEGISWAWEMRSIRPHMESLFDQDLINDPNDLVECIEDTKINILNMR